METDIYGNLPLNEPFVQNEKIKKSNHIYNTPESMEYEELPELAYLNSFDKGDDSDDFIQFSDDLPGKKFELNKPQKSSFLSGLALRPA